MKWEPKSLDELGYISRGRSRHRPRDAEHLYGGPYPFVQTGDVKHANLYLSTYTQTYSEAGLAQSKLWPKGTLCITIAANIAETSILAMDACFPDSIIGFVPEPDKADVRFIKYTLDIFKNRYRQFSQGAVQDNLSQEKLLSLKLPIPNLEIQSRIASILSTYDDLIENNHRRIHLLEAAARLVYQEWFVRLRFPGHEHVPVHNGVPEGWEKVPLGNALTLQRGFDLPTIQRVTGNVPVYASTGVTGYHNKAIVTGPGVVTGRSGSLGTVIYAPGDFWPLNTTLWVKEFKQVTPVYATHLLSGLRLEQYNGGAAVPTLNRNDVHRIDIVHPTPTLIERFTEVVEPMYMQIDKLKTYNSRLAQARDLLLPRLMSGKIAV